MTTVSDFKLGADPEFFVKLNGVPVSAYGLIKGTKEQPFPVELGAVQVDGMALEFNIHAATTALDFNYNIAQVLKSLREMVPEEYTFDYSPVAHFGADYLEAQPEDAKKLGCTPDFNAYTGDENPPPDAEMPFRTASGHIHIGWTEGMDIEDPEHLEACRMMVKQLDATLGLASIIIDPDKTRRELYGKAGAFRPKHYGVEYRVMSNVWLNEKWSRLFVFEQAKQAFSQLLNGKFFYKNKEKTIRETIDKSDVTRAYTLLAKTILIPGHLQIAYENWWAANAPELAKKEAKVWDKKAVAV